MKSFIPDVAYIAPRSLKHPTQKPKISDAGYPLSFIIAPIMICENWK